MAVPLQTRRSALLLAATAPLALRQGAASALGLESAPLPQMPAPSVPTPDARSRRNAVADAEAVFRDSDILRALRERSDANRGENARRIADKYCRRQAELGIGDCAGLQLIPGMTKNGLQKDAPKPWEQQLVENITGFFSKGDAAGAT